MKNKYIKRTHISEPKTRVIIRLFSLDIEAKKTAVLVGVCRPTINKFYQAFRERISEISESKSPFVNGEIELDESYFGARRVRGINHINGIENFWGLCKVRLTKFRGVHKHAFYLHIKECEFRYNYRNENIYLTLLRNIRNRPLKLS